MACHTRTPIMPENFKSHCYAPDIVDRMAWNQCQMIPVIINSNEIVGNIHKVETVSVAHIDFKWYRCCWSILAEHKYILIHQAALNDLSLVALQAWYHASWALSNHCCWNEQFHAPCTDFPTKCSFGEVMPFLVWNSYHFYEIIFEIKTMLLWSQTTEFHTHKCLPFLTPLCTVQHCFSFLIVHLVTSHCELHRKDGLLHRCAGSASAERVGQRQGQGQREVGGVICRVTC